MNRRFPKAALLLAGAALLFLIGVIRLFEMRFAVGDVFPAYSTMRADPLGTKAYYDSLTDLPGLRVERNLRPLHRLLRDAPTQRSASESKTLPPAVFYLGADPFAWPFIFTRDETERLDAILQQGGQLIISFAPSLTPLTYRRLENARETNRDLEEKESRSSPSPAGKDKDKEKEKGKDKADAKEPTADPKPPDVGPRRPLRSKLGAGSFKEDLAQRWQVDFQRINNEKTPAPSPSPLTTSYAVPAASGENVESVPWHTLLDFNLDHRAVAAGWKSLYLRDEKPVIISRNVGPAGGRIILASDSFFLSNEALRDDPSPVLLSALAGPARRLIFDETHFSISENPGLMALARRFRLEWALGAAGLLAALFIWKSMVSLVPPAAALAASTANAEDAAEPGRDSAAGFLNLVRRGVPARDLLAVCLAQWQASQGSGANRQPANDAAASRLRVIAEAEAAKPFHRHALAESYRAMCRALKKG